jgi:hypothetical protein
MKRLDKNIEQRIQGNIPGFDKLRNHLRSMWQGADVKTVGMHDIKRIDNKFRDAKIGMKGMFDLDQIENYNGKIRAKDIQGDEMVGISDVGKKVMGESGYGNEYDPQAEKKEHMLSVMKSYMKKKKHSALGGRWDGLG